MGENSPTSANRGRARGPGRPFQPGQSGNPGGRPKGVAARIKKLVGDDGKKAIEILWAIAQDTKAKTSDRIAASEYLLNRAFGKPAQPLTGGDGGPIQVERIERVIVDPAKP